MKIKLKKIKEKPSRDGSHIHATWKESAPFHNNPRGVISHRIKWVTSHIVYGQLSHHSYGYWCGNLAHPGEPTHDPRPRILCARCEAAAIAAGEKSADELVGGHVHIGGVRPFKTCCRNEGN